MLEKLKSLKDQKENYVKHQSTKTNINLNYDNGKVLILEMETENQEYKDRIVITPSGLQNSKKTKSDNNDDESIYFGMKELEEEPVNHNKIYNIYIGRKN